MSSPDRPQHELPLCACGRTATRKNVVGTLLCEACSRLIGLDGRG